MPLTPEERDRQKEIEKIKIEESLKALQDNDVRKEILKNSLGSYSSVMKKGCLLTIAILFGFIILALIF